MHFPLHRRLSLVLFFAVAYAGVAEDSSFGDIDASFLNIPVLSFADSAGGTTPAPSGFNFWNFIGKYLVPLAALTVGAFLVRSENLFTAGALMMYFGAQAIMNLYIKETLSNTMVSEEKNMRGVEASFFMTGIQQIMGFFCFLAYILITGYRPKKLETAFDYMAVCIFSVTFVLNIALNNYSLVLLPISVNMVIRSCNPLATSVCQVLLDKCRGERTNIPLIDWVLMSVGVGCAALVVWAQSQKSDKDDKHEDDKEHIFMGVIVALMSLCANAFNMVLAGCLGHSMKLSALDTTGYMSPPATILLIFPTFLFSHVTPKWKNHTDMLTDWQIVTEAFSLKPILIVFFLIMGPMAFGYNVLQYKLVHQLSPSHVTFAGNFNKFASIVLALIFGIDPFPTGFWVVTVFITGLLGNISAFTAYSLIKEKRKRAAPQETLIDATSMKSESGMEKTSSDGMELSTKGREVQANSSFDAKKDHSHASVSAALRDSPMGEFMDSSFVEQPKEN